MKLINTLLLVTTGTIILPSQAFDPNKFQSLIIFLFCQDQTPPYPP